MTSSEEWSLSTMTCFILFHESGVGHVRIGSAGVKTALLLLTAMTPMMPWRSCSSASMSPERCSRSTLFVRISFLMMASGLRFAGGGIIDVCLALPALALLYRALPLLTNLASREKPNCSVACSLAPLQCLLRGSS